MSSSQTVLPASQSPDISRLLTDPAVVQEVLSILESNGVAAHRPWLRLDLDSNLDLQLDSSDIRNLFSQFGAVEMVVMHPTARNSAQILMSSVVAAFFAQQTLHLHYLEPYSAWVYLRWCDEDEFARGDSRSSEESLGRADSRGETEGTKYTCRFDVQIENDEEYRVSRKLIGPKGANMKRILRECTKDCGEVPIPSILKLRLRGKGSGFLEGPNRVECKEPLHLCLSSRYYDKYSMAKKRVSGLLHKIYADYKTHCIRRGFLPAPELQVRLTEDVKVRQRRGRRPRQGFYDCYPPQFDENTNPEDYYAAYYQQYAEPYAGIQGTAGKTGAYTSNVVYTH